MAKSWSCILFPRNSNILGFQPFPSQEWSVSNFPCSLTRNITPLTQYIWRAWLCIAYSNERRRWFYQLSLPHLTGGLTFLTSCSAVAGPGATLLSRAILLSAKVVNTPTFSRGSITLNGSEAAVRLAQRRHSPGPGPHGWFLRLKSLILTER